ncbi:MAG: asparagine synthase (glutamine-hydrolyzing), partial [Burkholderiales bacterium]
MCGITGVLSGRHAPDPVLLERMAEAIRHRGPDDHGVWIDAAAGIGLAHRRLSILDLSAAGHQPMVSRSGRYVISYNGEIYNHLQLREALEGPWRGHSDTETLLAGIEAWGLAETLRRAVGMFAIALWDRERRRLLLARDRVGEKPLYYGWRNGALLFGSELSALRRHPAFAVAGDGIDRGALALLLRNNYIPAPYSIYSDIRKLPPGTRIELRLSETGGALEDGPTPYWSFYEAVERGQRSALAISEDEAVERIESTLQTIVRGQLISDVPLGAFLSGGIDSSTVVALMQRVSSRPVRTFTIGFHEEEYDEAQHAKAVAQHLGTDHTELYVTPEDALAVIPQLPAIYSEPFSDASQVPTFLVSKLARQHVTVSLSGDAGDELFGGYKRYFDTPRIWGRFAGIPAPLRRAIAASIRAVGPARWGALHRALRWALPGSLRDIDAVRKSRRVAEVMSLGSAGA